MVSIRKNIAKNTLKQLAALLLAVQLFAAPLLAEAEPIKPRRVAHKVFPDSKVVFDYYDQVKATKGRRIFSKPIERSVLQSPRSIWFHTPNLDRGLIAKTLQVLPMKLSEKWPGGPYEFTPVRTVESLTWGNFTEKFFGRREQFTRPVKFFGAVAFSIIVYMAVVGVIDHATAKKLLTEIETHKDFYDFFLFNDYRCRELAEAVATGDLTIEEARLLVYEQVQYVYSRWFSNRVFSINRSVEFLKTKLIDFPLFISLHNVVTSGLKPTPGYLIDKQRLGPLSDGQIRQLFAQTDHLAIKQEFITRLVKAPYNLEDDIDTRLFTSDLRSEVVNDPFNRQLLAMQQAGEISIGDLVYGMQENESWKTEYEHYETLHVQRLAVDSNQPITLAEIQQEILTDVKNHAKQQTDKSFEAKIPSAGNLSAQ